MENIHNYNGLWNQLLIQWIITSFNVWIFKIKSLKNKMTKNTKNIYNNKKSMKQLRYVEAMKT